MIPHEFDDIRGWKIAYSMDLGFHEVDEAVRRNTHKALDVFRELGAVVEAVDIGWSEESIKAALDHLSYCTMGAYILQFYRQDKDQLTGYARMFAERVQKVDVMQAYEAEMVTAKMWAALSAVFEHCHLFICPTIACTGVKADFDYSKDTVAINGSPVEPTLGWVMTYPFNMLSRCPVMALPSGRAANNVPTGIQIVGRPYDDLSVFQAAAGYENAVGPLFDVRNRPTFDA